MGKIYLAYGSNMNLEQMKKRCPHAKRMGPVVLKGWKLLFRGEEEGNAKATIEKEEGSEVPGLLWELQPSDETMLDRCEAYPTKYGKVTVNVVFEGKPVSAMAYVMNPGRSLGSPSENYYNTIKQGYEAAGFDIFVLDRAVEESSRQKY